MAGPMRGSSTSGSTRSPVRSPRLRSTPGRTSSTSTLSRRPTAGGSSMRSGATPMATVRSPEAPATPMSPAPEQSRARYPDETGFIERDGVRVFWERYGAGDRTILLMPTWSIVHSRRWKFQIPFLARHWKVVTFDGRGNGRSDRPQDAAAYSDREFAADAVAVLDATNTQAAVA